MNASLEYECECHLCIPVQNPQCAIEISNIIVGIKVDSLSESH